MNVVHPDHLAQHLESVQVVHGQDRAPLVLVAQKSKPLNRARDERDVCVRCFFAAIWMGKILLNSPLWRVSAVLHLGCTSQLIRILKPIKNRLALQHCFVWEENERFHYRYRTYLISKTLAYLSSNSATRQFWKYSKFPLSVRNKVLASRSVTIWAELRIQPLIWLHQNATSNIKNVTKFSFLKKKKKN